MMAELMLLLLPLRPLHTGATLAAVAGAAVALIIDNKKARARVATSAS
jgi:hypothetical protein